MKTKKSVKFIALIVALIMTAATAGCGGGESTNNGDAMNTGGKDNSEALVSASSTASTDSTKEPSFKVAIADILSGVNGDELLFAGVPWLSTVDDTLRVLGLSMSDVDVIFDTDTEFVCAAYANISDINADVGVNFHFQKHLGMGNFSSDTALMRVEVYFYTQDTNDFEYVVSQYESCVMSSEFQEFLTLQNGNNTLTFDKFIDGNGVNIFNTLLTSTEEVVDGNLLLLDFVVQLGDVSFADTPTHKNATALQGVSATFPASDFGKTDNSKEIFEIEPFTANLALPLGYSVEHIQNHEDNIYASLLFSPYVIKNQNGIVIGGMGYTTYEPYAEAEDEPKAIYSQLTLGNDYNFNVNDTYTPVVKKANGVSALVDVFRSSTVQGGDAECINYGVLCYDSDKLVYVAIELDSQMITPQQVQVIAESLMILD